MKMNRIRPVDVERRKGCSRPTLHRILKEPGYMPEERTIDTLAVALGVLPHWLRTGEEPMVAAAVGDTHGKLARIAEEAAPLRAAANLDTAFLQQVIREVLTQAPGESPERLADITAKAYDTALRTQRQDRIAKIVEMLVS